MNRREKAQRKYCAGKECSDGLVLHPLTLGKREILADFAQELDENELGEIAVWLYAHKLDEAEKAGNKLPEMARAFIREQTEQDLHEAQVVIASDFEAMAASAFEDINAGKEKAEEPSPPREGPSKPLHSVSA